MKFSKKAPVRKSAQVTFGQGIRLTNCTLKDGEIQTRKGLSATNYRLSSFSDSLPVETSVEMTDCYIYDEGELARIAFIIEDDLFANVTYRIKLILTNGRVKDLSQITFSRTTEYLFGRPDCVTIFSGEPTTGSGIYFMVRRTYNNQSVEDNLMIYELNKDKTMWMMLTEGDYYIPTILANGRGNAYRAAELTIGNIKFPSVVRPQSENLLSRRYRATYTADSHSHYFKLPYPCSQEQVVCRFNHYGIHTEWVFYNGESSATAEFGNQRITAVLSRKEGSIYFMQQDGRDFPLPYDGTLNNIVAEACTLKDSSSLLVASKTGAVQIDAGLMSAGSAVTAFYGGRHHPAVVVFNSPLSPLYFPAAELQSVGEDSTRVLKLTVCTDTLVAIRPEAIYTCPIKGVTLPSGEIADSLGAKADYLTTKRMFETAVALDCPPLERSVVPIGAKIFFVDETGKITSFSKQGKTLAYHGLVEPASFAFGIAIEGRYAYIKHKIVFFAQKEDGTEDIWELPQTIVGGYTFLGKTVLIGHCYYSPEGMYFTSVFRGEEDTQFFAQSNSIGRENIPLQSRIEVPLFEGLPRARKIFAVRVSADAESLTASITADGRSHPPERFYMSGENNYIICGDVARTARLSLSAEGNSLIKGVSYEYSEMNKM